MRLNILELFSVVTSLVTSQFGAKQKVIVWPINIAIAFLNLSIYYQATLYHKCIINTISILIDFYGWYRWLYGGKDKTVLPVTCTSSQCMLGLLVAGILATASVYKLLVFFDSYAPMLSAFFTGFAFVALWMTANKKLETHIVWFFLNIISIYLFYQRGLYLFSIKYAFYLILSAYGYWSWRASYLADPKEG